MSLRDVTGVFSRYFVVGFFLPAFFAVVVVSVIVASDRAYEKLVSQDRLLGLGGAALILGLLLLGLRHPVWKLFEGVISNRMGWRFPTAFGARTAAYRHRGLENWDLDIFLIWPLIAALFSPEEHELDVELETDARFFLNIALAILAIGAAAAAEVYDASALLSAVSVLLALVLAWLLYRCGVMAADRWGTQKVASTALHRRELYETLGFASDDPEAAGKTNHLMRVAPYGETAATSAASSDA